MVVCEKESDTVRGLRQVLRVLTFQAVVNTDVSIVSCIIWNVMLLGHFDT
jgi:hypothetical protein